MGGGGGAPPHTPSGYGPRPDMELESLKEYHKSYTNYKNIFV